MESKASTGAGKLGEARERVAGKLEAIRAWLDDLEQFVDGVAANALEREAIASAPAPEDGVEGPRPVFVGSDVIYRETGPTTDIDTDVLTDRPAKVIALHPSEDPQKPSTVDLIVFGIRGQGGTYGAWGIPESGKSPGAATIGDEPMQGTWRWPGGHEPSMPSGVW